MGSLQPATTRGNFYVLVIVDYLTKWAEAYAIPDQTTEVSATKIVEESICRFGIPEQLHSDQGCQFKSTLFSEKCNLFCIRKTHTTPLHPQSDGQTERMNRTLLDILSKLRREYPYDWYCLLPFAMAAYRSSTHTTTNEMPNRLMFGREVATPASLLAPLPPNEKPRSTWIESLHQRFKDTYRTVLTSTLRSHRTQKAVYDRKAKLYNFNEGDKMWLYDPKCRRGCTPKLDAKWWIGSFTVQRKLSGAAYLIKREGAAKGRIVNVDRLFPYVIRDSDCMSTIEEEETIEAQNTTPQETVMSDKSVNDGINYI